MYFSSTFELQFDAWLGNPHLYFIALTATIVHVSGFYVTHSFIHTKLTPVANSKLRRQFISYLTIWHISVPQTTVPV